MIFFEKYFPKNLPQLNFESILIISYGRSGSTLLQGVLNSIDGVVIRGENMNMCFHLFETYQALLKSKTHNGNSIQSPFYGSESLDEKYFLNRTKETVRNLLLANPKKESTTTCYGFKEIRYTQIHEDLIGYLEFLRKLFPSPCFIFNTRNNEDVVKSWISVGWYTESKKENAFKVLKEVEASFFNAMKANESNSFHITYEDVIGKTEKLEEMFSFLGAPVVESKIDEILSLQHSYKPFQKHIEKLHKKSSVLNTIIYQLKKRLKI